MLIKVNSIQMKGLLNYLLLLLLSIFSSFTSFAQDEGTVAPKYSNEFLAIGVGADALGNGNAFVAQTDGVSSGYWNPAGLTGVNKWLEVGLMHSEYFAGIAKYDYLGLAHSLNDRSAVAFSAIRFGVDGIPNTTQLIDYNGNIDYDRVTTFTAADYAFIFSYATKLGKIEGLSLGGNFKLIHRKVGDFAKSWGFGLDAGLQYQNKKNWKFGAMLRDATSTFNAWVFTLDSETQEVFINTGNSIPENGLELTLPRLILGGYKKIDFGKSGIYGAGELDVDITTDGRRNTLISGAASVDPHLGLSFGYKNYVTVRAGISNFQYVKNFDDSEKLNFQPNLGIGLNFKSFYLDYAFTDIGDASVALYSHVISLRLKLNKPENAVKE